jgi:hypothetical protein
VTRGAHPIYQLNNHRKTARRPGAAIHQSQPQRVCRIIRRHPSNLSSSTHYRSQMTSSAPWWSSGIFALATGILTAVTAALATVLPKRADRRAEQRRLSRELKERAYPELVRAAHNLVSTEVWKTEDKATASMLSDVTSSTHQVAFFGPPQVSQAASTVLLASSELADLITLIRDTSHQGHHGTVAQSHAASHAAAVELLRDSINHFATLGRADLEIEGKYTPLALKKAH